MAKISELPGAEAITGTETLPIVQGDEMRGASVLELLGAPGAADAIMIGERTLAHVLAAIQYPGMEITSLTIVPTQAEIGATVTANLTVVLTKSPTAQTVNGAALANPATARSAAVPNLSVTTAITWSVTDGAAPGGPATDTKTATITFLNKGHAGTINKASGVTSSEVNAMAQSWFASAIERTLTFTTSADGYLWYSQPASQPDPSAFKLGGLTISADKFTRSHTTATGQVVSYRDFLLSGLVPAGTTITLEVIA